MCNRRNNEKGLKEYKKMGDCESQKWDAPARKYLGEAALSLRSRRSGTKFANPCGFAH